MLFPGNKWLLVFFNQYFNDDFHILTIINTVSDSNYRSRLQKSLRRQWLDISSNIISLGQVGLSLGACWSRCTESYWCRETVNSSFSFMLSSLLQHTLASRTHTEYPQCGTLLLYMGMIGHWIQGHIGSHSLPSRENLLEEKLLHICVGELKTLQP